MTSLFSYNLSTGYEPGAYTALSSLYPGASNATRPYHYPRSQHLSGAQNFLFYLREPIVFGSFLLTLVPRSLLVSGGSTPTCCTWRFYPDQLFASCTWRLYPDQLHLAALPRPIFYFLRSAVLSRPSAIDGSNPCARRLYPDHLHLAILTRPIF